MFDEMRISQLLEKAASAFGMDEERRARFLQSRCAKLIATLPFAAKAPMPDRIALAHLAVFVFACEGESRFAFDHVPADDISPFARLAPIADHPGGEPAVVRAGLARLALMMLAGYEHDAAGDKAAGRYNPIVSGAWRSETIRADLRSAAAVPTPELDSVLTADEAVTVWWDW